MKGIKSFIYLIIIALVAIALVACNDEISLEASVGETVTWNFACESEIDEIRYEFSDPSLAKLIYTSELEGASRPAKLARITALGEGKVTVTATSTVDESFKSTLILNITDDRGVSLGDGSLTQDITLENDSAELYREDTTVTYKVTTSKLVDSIKLMSFDSTNGYLTLYSIDDARTALNENTFCEIYSLEVHKASLTDGVRKVYDSGKNGKIYSSKRTEQGDSAVWEIEWNVGNSAVKFVEILATDNNTVTTQSSIAHLNVHYPTVSSEESLEDIITLWVKNNVDGPLYFKLDTSGMTNAERLLHYGSREVTAWADCEVFALQGYLRSRSELEGGSSSVLKLLAQADTDTLYDAMFDASAIYRDNFVAYLTSYGMVTPLDASNQTTLPQVNENMLVSDPVYDSTYAFYYPITDEIRAVIAYQNGTQIDKSLFPYAHSILERATEVLDEIIEPDMTDFEKEREIYAWMVRNQQNQIHEPAPEHAYACTKTAYGFLNGYGGDCMGYSGTFFTLCNMAGVECSTVDTYAVQDGETGGPKSSFSANHRINLVRLDGEYYFVEAFWFYQKHDPSEGDFRFMNMTSEKAKNHYVWADDSIWGPPVCDYSTYLVHENTCELINGK